MNHSIRALSALALLVSPVMAQLGASLPDPAWPGAGHRIDLQAVLGAATGRTAEAGDEKSCDAPPPVVQLADSRSWEANAATTAAPVTPVIARRSQFVPLLIAGASPSAAFGCSSRERRTAALRRRRLTDARRDSASSR